VFAGLLGWLGREIGDATAYDASQTEGAIIDFQHRAAAFLHIHYKTLERKARMRQVPAMKFGKEWQFLLSLLSEWQKDQMNSNLNEHQPPNNKGKKESENL
jgi:hypothetical protein